MEKLEEEFQKPKGKKRKGDTLESSKPKLLKKSTTAYHIVKCIKAVRMSLINITKKICSLLWTTVGFITQRLW